MPVAGCKRLMRGQQAGPRKKKRAERGRTQAKTHFYTYPRCPASPDEFLVFLNTLKKPIERYIICREQHTEPEEEKALVPPCPTHLHVYCRFVSKQTVSWSSLTFSHEGVDYRGNYQSCRSPDAVVAYVAKDGDYITNFPQREIDKMIAATKYKGCGWGDIVTLAQAGEREEYKKMLYIVAPRDAALGGERLLRSLAALSKKKPEKLQSGRVFVDPPGIAGWRRHKVSLVLLGATNLGKTSYAQTLFESPFVCTHNDGLRKYKPDVHDAIIFDDCNFAFRDEMWKLHITGVQDTAQVNVKYGNVEIPAGTPRVFINNQWMWGKDPSDALIRRVFVVVCKTDLRVLSAEDQAADPRPQDDLEEALAAYQPLVPDGPIYQE